MISYIRMDLHAGLPFSKTTYSSHLTFLQLCSAFVAVKTTGLESRQAHHDAFNRHDHRRPRQYPGRSAINRNLAASS